MSDMKDDRIRELEQEVEYLQTDVGLRDDHIRDYLEDIKRLEQRLSNRDAAWERALRESWPLPLTEHASVPDAIVAAIHKHLDAEQVEGGEA